MGHVELLAALKTVAIGPTGSDAKKRNTSSGTERFNITSILQRYVPVLLRRILIPLRS